MKKFNLILAIFACLMLSSCGFVSHNWTNQDLTNTTVVLQKKNYHIVKAVTGESSQTYVFGIGGLSRKSLRDDAIRDMYRQAELTGSQAIINQTVTMKTQFYLVVGKVKCQATALVVEFDE